MRVLVTGGAGFVGSVSVRLLLDRGHEVTVLDSLERGHAAAVDTRARIVVADVGHAGACSEALAGCEAVLHCAGYIDVAESVSRPDVYTEANLRKPLVLLDAMEGAGVSALVFSSTAAVYGEPQVVPIPEDHPKSPMSPYGGSKLAFERALDARSSGGLRSVVLRYFNAAGAWPDGSIGEAHDPETHLIPRVLGALAAGRSCDVYGSDYPTRDGTCVRDYVHVVDLAEAHVSALERLAEGGSGGTYNLGGGRGFTNLEVVNACAATLGVEAEVVMRDRRAGDPAVLVADASRAATELGWRRSRGSLETIVADAWRWHSTHPRGYAG